MKKLILPGLIAALALSSVAKAELELSGNVTTVTAYQHDDKDAATMSVGGATLGDLGGGVGCANCDHFYFVVDQVELDVENEFGENIRARADIDFRDVFQTPLRFADVMDLEQGYVTANIGVGNGMEFLIGKFNSPIGYESVDRHENAFTFYSLGWTYLLPKSLMGAKVYYEFSDHWNFDFAVVNSMNGVIGGNSAYPSAIFRVGAIWGDEGNETYIHLGAGVGPESGFWNADASQNKHLDYLGDLWGNWAIGDFWDVGWEAIYRQSNSVSGGANQKAIAGQLVIVWQASDVWSMQWGGGAHWEVNPAGARGSSGASTTGSSWDNVLGFGGVEGMIYSGTVGATYMITDDAKLKFEGRYDLANTAGPRNNADFMSGAVQFAYSF